MKERYVESKAENKDNRLRNFDDRAGWVSKVLQYRRWSSRGVRNDTLHDYMGGEVIVSRLRQSEDQGGSTKNKESKRYQIESIRQNRRIQNLQSSNNREEEKNPWLSIPDVPVK